MSLRLPRLKWVLLGVLTGAVFATGFAITTYAGTIFGRQYNTWADGYGYFLNRLGSCPGGSRDDVLPGGIPTTIDTADEFINTIKNYVNNGDRQHKTGASFIVKTMIGNGQGGTSATRFNPPNAAQMAEWEQRVRYSAAKGLIRYRQTFTYSLNTCYQGNANVNNNDDMFWDEVASGYGVQTTLGIQFLNSAGTVVFQIRYECGNPVGKIGGIQDSPNYTITGRTTVSSPTVFPGQSVTFQHYLRDTGSNAATINWTTKNGQTNANISSGSSAIGANAEVNVSNETIAVPSNTAFGTQYCRYISFSPATYGYGSGNGATVCTTVVAQFGLVPTVSPSSSTAQQNDQITFTYNINNSGPTRSTTVTCKVAGQTQGTGYTELPQQDADRNPAVAPQPSLNCGQEFPTGVTPVGAEVVDVGSAPVGSNICRSLVVNPKDQTGGFRSSAEVCVTIAKSPYVQFMGNDVWAGGNFAAINPACNTSAKIQTVAHTLQDGSVAGSAVEYAAFALGKITTFGSANQALVNPGGPAGKALTFSNRDSNNLGFYGAPQHCINDYVAAYDKTPNDSAAAAINVGSQASGTKLNLSGPRSFSGTMPAGSQQVYLVEGDVTITGDIKYPANYSGLDQIPSLVIIATGNITVNRNVQQMDGLFVSRGQFFTCDVAVGTTLSVNPPCEQQLTINGAVIAGRLQLLRTFGADGSNDALRKRPAEIFNFNSEMYLRNALNGNAANVLQTVDEKDLPPRF